MPSPTSPPMCLPNFPYSLWKISRRAFSCFQNLAGFIIICFVRQLSLIFLALLLKYTVSKSEFVLFTSVSLSPRIETEIEGQSRHTQKYLMCVYIWMHQLCIKALMGYYIHPFLGSIDISTTLGPKDFFIFIYLLYLSPIQCMPIIIPSMPSTRSIYTFNSSANFCLLFFPFLFFSPFWLATS